MSFGDDIEGIVNQPGFDWTKAGSQVRERLARGIPQSDFDFLTAKKLDMQRDNNKIVAIKAARERFRFGLKAGKVLIDEIAAGATMIIEAPPITVELRDAIATNVEQMATICRESAKLTVDCTDGRIQASLLGILGQLQELWVALITKPR